MGHASALTSRKAIKAIDEVVMNNPRRIAVYFKDTDSVRKCELSLLFFGLRSNTYLNILALVEIGLDDTQGLELASALKQNYTLTYLDLHRNKLTFTSLNAILKAMEKTQTVKYLTVGRQKADRMNYVEEREIALRVQSIRDLMVCTMPLFEKHFKLLIYQHVKINRLRLKAGSTA